MIVLLIVPIDSILLNLHLNLEAYLILLVSCMVSFTFELFHKLPKVAIKASLKF